MSIDPEPGQVLLRIYLLGPPAIEWQAQNLTVPRRLVRALLYRLVAQPEHISREYLCSLFWPEIAPDIARRNLSHLLTHLRRALPHPGMLKVDEQVIGLENNLLWCDVTAFHQLLQKNSCQIEDMQRAASLYRGSFLEGFFLPGSVDFEQWANHQQSILSAQYLNLLRQIAKYHTQHNETAAAIMALKQVLVIDDLSEEVHCQLMQLYAAQGERSAALRQFEVCSVALERELGISPLPETRLIYQAIRENRQIAGLNSRNQHSKPIPDLRSIIGRQIELNHMAQLFTNSQNEKIRLVLLSGEAGIGKTSLLHAFARSLAEHTPTLFGGGHPGEQSIPYQPIIQAVRSYNNLTNITSALPSYYLEDLSRLLPEIRLKPSSTSITIETSHRHNIDNDILPEVGRLRLFEALAKTFLGIHVAHSSLLLVLDDLQWADPSTLTWLGYFTRSLAETRPTCKNILCLAAYRVGINDALADLRNNLADQDLVTEIELHGLGLEPIQTLVHQFAGKKQHSTKLALRLLETTGGNPLYILEILRWLVENKRLSSPADDTWKKLPIPESIRQALASRLRLLTEQERQILEAGAVLGRAFDLERLRRTAGRGEFETVSTLERLTAQRLLVPEGGSFRFAHELTRQTVLASLSPVRKQLLHHRAALAIKLIEQDQEHHSYEALAAHYAAGGNKVFALENYHQAAKKAEMVFAWQEAELHYTQALKIVSQLPASLLNNRIISLWVEMLTGRAHLYFLQGRLAQRDADLVAMEKVSSESQNTKLCLEAITHRVRYLTLDGHYSQAIASASKGIVLAEQANDSRSRARLLSHLGFAHYFLGHPRPALDALQAALSIVSSTSDTEMHGRIVHILGYIYFHFGEYPHALAYQQEALACHRQTGDTNRQAWDLLDIGRLYLEMGQLSQGQSILVDDLDQARRLGLQPVEVHCLATLGYFELYQRNPQAARNYFIQALALQKNIRSHHTKALIENGLAIAHWQRGELAEANQILTGVAENSRSIGHRRLLVDALFVQGLVDITSGQYTRAIEQLQEAYALATESEYNPGAARCLAASARAERLAGKQASALKFAQQALTFAEEKCLATCTTWSNLEAGLAWLELAQPEKALSYLEQSSAYCPSAHQCWISFTEVSQALQAVQTRSD